MSRILPEERILLVDDLLAWAKDFVDILHDAAGERRAVDIQDVDEFMASFRSAQQFEQYGICLVDLELRGGTKPNAAGDFLGLTQVLPSIRRLAPWMPVACISRYIANDSPIIAELSTSDFDFFSPKGMMVVDATVPHPEFNPKHWKESLRAMQLKRIASTTGRSVDELKVAINSRRTIETDSSVEASLTSLGLTKEVFAEALAVLGIEGSEFLVESLQPGFSGVNVARLRAHGYADGEPIYAYWLLKWGRPFWKIEEELQAHRRFLCRGLERTLQVPQLHAHVVPWRGAGYAAYAFEKEARLAIELVRAGSIDALEGPFRAIANGLYSNAKRLKPVKVRPLLSHWVALSDAELNYILPDGWPDSCDVTWSLLHGDLHLRNIFVNNSAPALIDFARSNFGPVAIDVAKALIDALIVGLPATCPRSLTIEAFKASKLQPLLAAFEPYLSAPQDIIFANAALRSYAYKYTTYSDVNSDAREALQRLLTERTQNS
jgi:hypothetical protein